MNADFRNWLKSQAVDPAMLTREELETWRGYFDDKAPQSNREGEEFMKVGFQYYVAARSAVLAHLLPTCGNL